MNKWITNRVKLMVFVLLCICTVPISLSAGNFDGSVPVICATIETFECGPGDECERGTAETIDIPQFFRINFDKKTISGTLASGEVRTTKIENMEQIDGKLILQGVEKGLGWSMVITEITGKMALTASGDQVGFVVFGACTPQ